MSPLAYEHLYRRTVIDPGTTLGEARELMSVLGVSSLIVRQGGEVVGVVADSWASLEALGLEASAGAGTASGAIACCFPSVGIATALAWLEPMQPCKMGLATPDRRGLCLLALAGSTPDQLH